MDEDKIVQSVKSGQYVLKQHESDSKMFIKSWSY